MSEDRNLAWLVSFHVTSDRAEAFYYNTCIRGARKLSIQLNMVTPHILPLGAVVYCSCFG